MGRTLVTVPSPKLFWRNPALVWDLHLQLQRVPRVAVPQRAQPGLHLPSHNQGVRGTFAGEVWPEEVGTSAGISEISSGGPSAGSIHKAINVSILTMQAILRKVKY